MSDELLYAELVHPSTIESLNQRFSPLNTFMLAGTPYKFEFGTYLVTHEVRIPDPFEEGHHRVSTWRWNLTKAQIEAKYELADLFDQNRRFMLIPKK